MRRPDCARLRLRECLLRPRLRSLGTVELQCVLPPQPLRLPRRHQPRRRLLPESWRERCRERQVFGITPEMRSALHTMRVVFLPQRQRQRARLLLIRLPFTTMLLGNLGAWSSAGSITSERLCLLGTHRRQDLVPDRHPQTPLHRPNLHRILLSNPTRPPQQQRPQRRHQRHQT